MEALISHLLLKQTLFVQSKLQRTNCRGQSPWSHMGLSAVLKGIMLREQGCNLKLILLFPGHPCFKLNLRAYFHNLQANTTTQIKLFYKLGEYCTEGKHKCNMLKWE